jgi:hypothetical protein
MREKVFISLMAAVSILAGTGLNAMELTVRAAKVALKPGETQLIKVLCHNNEAKEFNGKLKVKVSYELSDSAMLAENEVKLAAGEKKEFSFNWKPSKEYWGCTAQAELSGAEKSVTKSRYDFTVTTNLPMAASAYGCSHSTGGMKPEAIRERIQEFADCGVPIVELYSWTPNLWGNGVCPETESWRAGQGNYVESAKSLDTLIGKAHDLGMLVYSYAQPSFRGKAGKEWCEKHPEDVLYRTPEHKLDEKKDVNWFAAYANPFNKKNLDTGLDSYAKAFKRFKFDGIRWDGQPGVFYHPVGDWVTRCNGGVSSFPYDSNGKPIIISDPDKTNAKLVEYVYRRLNKDVPGLLWGFNICMGSNVEGGGFNTIFPTMFRKISEGNLILQERHFHNSGGRPYMWMNQRWSTIIEGLAYSSELMHVLGGYLYRGDFGFGYCEPFLKHVFAIHYASRARTFAVCPWYKSIKGAGKYPYDFVRFAMRFGKYLYHPSLHRFNSQRPLQRISVTSQAPFPVLYENFCYDLCSDKKFRTVVHLLNSPVTDQVNTRSTVAPPWFAEKTVVSVRHPLGMDKKTAKYYVLSPEWDERIVEVKPDNSRSVTNVEVPQFRYWAIVICEYSIGAGEQEYSSEGELFLPVLHRKGEI